MKEPLWTKSFIMLIFANLFLFMSFQMLIPTLPAYIKSLGASGFEIGLVTAMFSIGAVLCRPYIGFLLRFSARKPLVVLSAVALLFVTIIHPITQIVAIVLIIRLLHGIAWGISTTANGTAAVDIVPNSRLGEGMGYFGLSVTIGMIVAPSLGIFLYQVTTFTNLIYISSFLGVIAIILFSVVQYETPEEVRKAKKEEIPFSYFGSFIEKSSWYPALITVMVTFGYGTIVTFIVIFGDERGIKQIFLFYLLNAIMASISRPIAGKWFDKHGPKSLVVLCISLAFIGLWVVSLAHSNLMIAIAGVLFGVGFGSLIPTLQSWTLSQTPPERRGVANGMFFSSIDLGIGLSGLIFGVVAQFVEIAVLFQISSIFLIIALFFVLFQRKEKRRVLPQPQKISS
ncbi:MFS transporter [Sutcliffiella sp. NC1]|uniref:MFS transporter n=1 Tax=Sutcliffiella sp. NC1 TaxID=3004096 RepID=UPI0022DD105C|nr:MFS transporter [Sutcliffiella sp. NC1]WBL17500.1 MFS transporter [Sutcliffiella sp. NC1]